MSSNNYKSISYSQEVHIACKKTGAYCNKLAMKCLSEENFTVCRKLLEKALPLSERFPELKIDTYNNLACIFRRTGKLRVALDYLEKIIVLEMKMEEATSAADTHLNACAVLSQLNYRH